MVISVSTRVGDVMVKLTASMLQMKRIVVCAKFVYWSKTNIVTSAYNTVVLLERYLSFKMNMLVFSCFFEFPVLFNLFYYIIN